ncbi:MAG: DUF72 domain-containing protein [Verrucomicrobiota bacterium]
MIWIGTSGFQYPEWKGKFYPKDLSSKKMLPFYATKFSTTEVNYTFRRIPMAQTLFNWNAQTPAGFRFALKAPQKITHHQKLVGSAEILDNFWAAARTLGEKLGPILFQLPPFLKKDLPRLEDFLSILPKGIKAAFEFRHESWFDDSVFATLKSCRVALCIADNEKLTTPCISTADFGYFRLRDQYDKTGLTHWAKVIAKEREQLTDGFVYFKHEETGRGPQFAEQLKVFLKEII